MPFYETVFIARQDVTAKQADDLAKKFSEIVSTQGGKVARTESWGLRSLAYRINKNRKGHYQMMHLDCEPKAITEMERLMKINEDILRYMTVRMDKMPEGPSVMMRGGSDLDDVPFVAEGEAA